MQYAPVSENVFCLQNMHRQFTTRTFVFRTLFCLLAYLAPLLQSMDAVEIRDNAFF